MYKNSARNFQKVLDICEEIKSYIDNDKYEVIEDRKKAIEKAIKEIYEDAGRIDIFVNKSKFVFSTFPLNS